MRCQSMRSVVSQSVWSLRWSSCSCLHSTHVLSEADNPCRLSCCHHRHLVGSRIVGIINPHTQERVVASLPRLGDGGHWKHDQLPESMPGMEMQPAAAHVLLPAGLCQQPGSLRGVDCAVYIVYAV